MAQDFESTGILVTNSETTIYTSNSDDAIVGLRLANILTTAIQWMFTLIWQEGEQTIIFVKI